MQVVDRISALERRAATLNLTLWRVCRLADVDYGNVSRWKRGLVSPTVRTLDVSLGAVEAKMDELEQEMIAALSERSSACPPRLPA